MAAIRFSLSEKVYAAVRQWFADHPVITMEVIRDADLGSPLVRIDALVCEECGWEFASGPIFIEALKENLAKLGEEMPAGKVPGDLIKSIAVTHAFDQQSRATYCGGNCRFELSR